MQGAENTRAFRREEPRNLRWECLGGKTPIQFWDQMFFHESASEHGIGLYRGAQNAWKEWQHDWFSTKWVSSL